VLRLKDDWVWDSWIADDCTPYHLFFLAAPRALSDPALPHTAARIGHATSTDLVHWNVHHDALVPAAGRWDDLALWTGSVLRGEDGIWRLYYSGLSATRALGARDQRIGIADQTICSAGGGSATGRW
jgi:beta-fructofuranosidase